MDCNHLIVDVQLWYLTVTYNDSDVSGIKCSDQKTPIKEGRKHEHSLET